MRSHAACSATSGPPPSSSLDRQFPPLGVLRPHRGRAAPAARSSPEAERIGVSDEARRQLGRIRTSLEFRHRRRHRRPARPDAARAVRRHDRLARHRLALLPVRPAADVDQGRGVLMRRFRIVHHDALHYDGRVRAAHNELRMTPVNEPGQTTLENRIRIRPMTWSRSTATTGAPRHGDGEPVRAPAARHRGDLHRRAHPRRAPRAVAGLDGRPGPRRPGPQLRVAHALAPAPAPAGGRRPRRGRARAPDPASRRRGAVRPRPRRDELRARRHRRCTAAARTPGPSGPASARTSPTSPSGRCAASGSRPATSPGYLVPKRDVTVGETSTGESHAWVEFWDNELGRLRPDQRHRRRPRPHRRRPRPRLRGRPAVQGHLLGPRHASLEVSVAITRLA